MDYKIKDELFIQECQVKPIDEIISTRNGKQRFFLLLFQEYRFC